MYTAKKEKKKEKPRGNYQNTCSSKNTTNGDNTYTQKMLSQRTPPER
jgi:hypothetical protein